MPDAAANKASAESDTSIPVEAQDPDKDASAAPVADDHMEDEEKVLAGRNDVNYPALLTKDVPGG